MSAMEVDRMGSCLIHSAWQGLNMISRPPQSKKRNADMCPPPCPPPCSVRGQLRAKLVAARRQILVQANSLASTTLHGRTTLKPFGICAEMTGKHLPNPHFRIRRHFQNPQCEPQAKPHRKRAPGRSFQRFALDVMCELLSHFFKSNDIRAAPHTRP